MNAQHYECTSPDKIFRPLVAPRIEPISMAHGSPDEEFAAGMADAMAVADNASRLLRGHDRQDDGPVTPAPAAARRHE